MHELALTESILGIAVEEARKAGAGRVSVIRLRIGVLTDVVPDTLQFYLDALSRGTPAEGARLETILMPVGASCARCDTSFHVQNDQLLCPQCGAPGSVTQGRELAVDSLEVED